MIAELDIHFPFGVLLVTDQESTEYIPDWGSADELVTAAATAFVMSVRHEQDGPSRVRLWSHPPSEPLSVSVGAWEVAVPSGTLRRSRC